MTRDSAAPGSPLGLRASGQTSGHEGDTSAGGARTSRGGSGEGDTPAGLSSLPQPRNPFRVEQQKPNVEDWRVWANCLETDPDIFHPEQGKSMAPAKKVCASCPVTMDCLEYALDQNLTMGVYGGLSERERRGLHRDHRAFKRAS